MKLKTCYRILREAQRCSPLEGRCYVELLVPRGALPSFNDYYQWKRILPFHLRGATATREFLSLKSIDMPPYPAVKGGTFQAVAFAVKFDDDVEGLQPLPLPLRKLEPAYPGGMLLSAARGISRWSRRLRRFGIPSRLRLDGRRRRNDQTKFPKEPWAPQEAPAFYGFRSADV